MGLIVMKNKSSRDISVRVILLLVFDLEVFVIKDVEQGLKFVLEVHLVLVFVFFAILIVIVI